MNNLEARMKQYEQTFNQTAVKRIPLMVRVDGRAFHTLTKNANKPFDSNIMSAMINSTIDVARNMQGFKVAYVQSDEATFLLTDYDTITSDGWFGYKINKIVSTSAALMSVAFNRYYNPKLMATFDSRVFNIPEDDVVNNFLWRALDWKRNSLEMYCGKFFAHSQLYKKNAIMKHDMLYNIGKSWAVDLSNLEKNGTFILNTDKGFVVCDNILPDYNSINNAIANLFGEK